jgi:hypothetical protein
MRRRVFVLMPLVVLIAGSISSRADERLEGIACRSVHWQYAAGDGIAFYNEVTVEQSATGTYFCVCGWNKGYFGLQELASGKKLLIFSIWDSGQNDPKAVAEERRVKLLHTDEKVRIGRFGGEGTGGQSFFDYEWKTGQTYRFLVRAKIRGERTEYAGYFYVPEDAAWKHLVTFSTITGGRPLGGYYSFVEDFQRDRVSATRTRQARFGNGWVQSADGRWQAIQSARFTADSNPAENINAGIEDGQFFLATGGATKNTGARLQESMTLPKLDTPPRPPAVPED